MCNLIKISDFGYKGDKGMVEGLKKRTWMEESLDSISDICLDYVLEFLKEKS